MGNRPKSRLQADAQRCGDETTRQTTPGCEARQVSTTKKQEQITAIIVITIIATVVNSKKRIDKRRTKV